MKRVLSLITAQRVLCVLALVLSAGAAKAWPTYNFDYVGTWVANHNLSQAVGRCIGGWGGCTGSRRVGRRGRVVYTRYRRGRVVYARVYVPVAPASLYTGEDFAFRDGIIELMSYFPPEKQADVARVFATLILYFDKLVPPTYGIPKNNLATAYTAILAGSYTAYTNRPFPDNAVRPLFRQAEQAILNSPALSQASLQEKNKLYQKWVGVGTFMLGWQDQIAKYPNPQGQAQMQQAGANVLRSFGIEPSRVSFTANGMILN